MSDTDDTDTLLLIPPDRFAVASSDSDASRAGISHKECDPHCEIVDSLLGQVSQIENRLTAIESTAGSVVSDTSSVHRSEMFSSDNRPLSKQYMTSSVDDLYLHKRNNMYYTPHKHYSRFSSSLSPLNFKGDMHRTSAFSTGKKNYRARHGSKYAYLDTTDDLKSTSYVSTDSSTTASALGAAEAKSKADMFTDCVKTIKHSVQKDLNPLFDKETAKSTHSGSYSPKSSFPSTFQTHRNLDTLNMKELDKMISDMEAQQKEIDTKLRNKETEFFGLTNAEKRCYTRQGDLKDSAPNLHLGMRDIMFDMPQAAVPIAEEIAVKKTVRPQSSTSAISKSSSLSSNNFSQNTAIQVPQPTENKTATDSRAFSSNLVSLNVLWGSNVFEAEPPLQGEDSAKVLGKLKEEKYRRLHCEQTIQQLQLKLLEAQQRIAVAVQVDCAKDEAILRLHEAWEKVVAQWKMIEVERNDLSQQLAVVHDKSREELVEVIRVEEPALSRKIESCARLTRDLLQIFKNRPSEKAEYYEKEVTKALDLAHDNKEKCVALEREKLAMENDVKSLRENLEKTTNELVSSVEYGQHLSETVSSLEKESSKEKKLIADLQKEVTKLRKTVDVVQSECSCVKQDLASLQGKLKEEHAKKSALENQKKNLQAAVDNAKKSEKSQLEEVQKVIHQAEQAKTELRDFYQKQVDGLVKDKLKEFQIQLEQAEKSLQDELKTRELAIASTAAQQLHKLTEKHQLEIKLLEEKHSEEMRLYQLQLSQALQQIESLNIKLQQQQMKKTHIAEQLHGVMEAQWMEAMKIINNGRTPSFTNPVETRSTAPEFHSSTPIIDARTQSVLDAIRKDKAEAKVKFTDTLNAVPSVASLGSSNGIDAPTANTASTGARIALPVDTPVTSRLFQSVKAPEIDFQKYLQMMLTKQSDNPTNDNDNTLKNSETGKSNQSKANPSKRPWK